MVIIRRQTNDLSIRPKMSKRVFMAIVVGGVFALFASLYIAYSQGVTAGFTGQSTAKNRIDTLEQQLDELKKELEISEEGLIFAQRQRQIQEEAYNQMSKAYANSEQKNQVLGSRLDFYRSIISPEDGQSGPSIQNLTHSFDGSILQFDVTLVQAIRHKHQVRGTLRVSLFENDVEVAQWPSSSPRSVSYQYFQQVSGSIDRTRLAANSKLKVVLSLQDGEPLERWYMIDSTSSNIAANPT